jgi:hypothetical protein
VTWNRISKENRVTFRWIRAHVGHPGNEKADELAKKGTKISSPRVYANPGMSITKLKLDKKVETNWLTHWGKAGTLNQSRKFYSGPDINKTIELLKLRRPLASKFIQTVTGFNNLNFHSFKKDDRINPMCRGCDMEEERIWHLLTECPATVMLARAELPMLQEGRTDS